MDKPIKEQLSDEELAKISGGSSAFGGVRCELCGLTVPYSELSLRIYNCTAKPKPDLYL